LPQLQNLSVQSGRLIVVVERQRRRDRALGVEDALSLDLRRVRRERRAHERAREAMPNFCAGDVRRFQMRKRRRQRARLWRRTGTLVVTATTVLMHVLGDVREVREIRERAHDVQGLFNAQVRQHRVERTMRRPLAMKAHGLLANRLDLVERRLAALRPNHVAEQSPEQSRVGLERRVFVFNGKGGGGSRLSVHRSIMLQCTTTENYRNAR